MATNSGKDNKSVFDVSKPGKTAANASSRPLILGHKTMVQDHTMVGPEVEKKEEAAPEVPEEPMKLPTRSKTITPPSEEKETPPKPANDSSQEPEVNPQDLSSSESAVVDAIAEQAAGKKKDGNVSKEDKEKQKALDKLIEDKTYFLNITPPARKRNMRAAVISLVIVLVGVVGLAAAADAEILNLGFKPPFDFIKKDTKQTAAIVPAVAVPAVVPTPKATTPAVTVPDGYVEYTNKELGFKFAYPKTDPWLNRVNGPTAAFIVSQPTDKFVYNYRSYDMPTYYDKAKQQWYTLSGSKKTYISEGTDLLKVYTSGERKMFLFLGKGAQYCGSRHLLFEQGQNMVMIWLPEACSEDAKKDPDPVWNKKTYFVPQLDAELEKIVPTIKSLI